MSGEKSGVPPVIRRGSKYRNSAKALLPYRGKKATGHPVDNAGFFSSVLFTWLTGLVWRLYRKPIDLDTIWPAPKQDTADINCERFLRIWEEERKKGERASMKSAIMRFIRTRLIASIMCVFVFTLCQFTTNGVIIQQLLRHIETSGSNWKISAILVSAMFLVEVTRVLFFSMGFAVSMRTGVRARSGLLLAVYQKILRVPPTESSSVGEIINVCSSDGDRIYDALYVGPLLFVGPTMFVASTIFLVTLVGPIALFGCSLFLIVMFLQVFLLKALNSLRHKAIENTDKRVKSINEIVSAIKLIKMYAWEDPFRKMVEAIRNTEKKYLHWAMFLQSFNISLSITTPYAATIVTLVFSIIMGRNITASVAFTCLAMFHVMSFCLKVIPIGLKAVAEAGVAADRIQKIMQRGEYVPYLKASVSSPDVAIELQKATLAWQSVATSNADDEKSAKAHNGKNGHAMKRDEEQELVTIAEKDAQKPRVCLSNVTLTVEQGSLVAVCGRVGCGKSSLISAALGQMQLIDGAVATRGSVAYCAQQAWIMNATIRDNITFGLAYDEDKYQKIIEACCLLPDFAILQSGDRTEVGERGINLSGGQKQRINIARAIYMDTDVYLLDDPLSAVDAHVGKSLFENAILKMLKEKGKTILLVTHRLEYLPHCDQIVLMKDGTIWEHGNHEDLLDRGEEYYQLYKLWSKEQKEDVDADKAPETTQATKATNADGGTPKQDLEMLEKGRLMTKEEKAEGAIKPQTYYMYMRAGGGFFAAFLTIILFLMFVCCLQFTTIWMSYWLKQGSGDNVTYSDSSISNFTESPTTNETFIFNTTPSVDFTPTTVPEAESMFSPGKVIDNPRLYFYLSVFGYTVAATFLVMIVKGYVFITVTLRASHQLHKMLFDKILHSTMEFFDTTPAGRILNRFQKDQDMLDSIVPMLLEITLNLMMFIVSCVVFVSYVFPYFLVALLVITPIFLAMFFIFKGAVREMRRQDNYTRSPLLSHIATTITGIPTIRAYDRGDDFTARFSDLLDHNTVPFYLYNAVNRWLVTRLDFMTLSIIIICAILVVATSGLVPPALAGLALSSALMVSGIFQYTVRTLVETEANMVSAERIVHYIKTVPQEVKTPDKTDIDPKWPAFGSVRFTDVNMRYREGLPLVLQGVSFTINTTEKVGVVGRTGSGKSSLGVALFRLVDLASGSIQIDGVDIAELSLRQLRSKIAIIPQEPVLFTGTVKYNVDPFNEFTEDQVWEALERTHLKDAISALPLQLGAAVSENGGNFSVGERQLMCLARALLRHNKILLLDEATASIDARTDRLVQETISEHFSDCTMITIAHRLHTVTTCDRIMVLDKGTVIEFDTPEVLSKDPNSMFSKLLATSK